MPNLHKYIIITLSILSIISCKTSKEDIPTIGVTIEPIRYFVNKIVGEEYKVVSLVPKGSNPETYDPTPATLISLSESKAYFYMGGLGFEKQWIDKLKENCTDVQFVNISEGINLINDIHHNNDNKCINHNSIDPHIWMSSENAKIIAKHILNGLINIDNNKSNEFTERYNLLINEIDSVDKYIRKTISSEDVQKKFMIYHPTLSYYAQEYGLQQIVIEQEAKSPTSSQLKKLIDEAEKDNINIIFLQPEFDKRNVQIVGETIGADIVRIHPLAENWADEMILIIDKLKIKK